MRARTSGLDVPVRSVVMISEYVARVPIEPTDVLERHLG